MTARSGSGKNTASTSTPQQPKFETADEREGNERASTTESTNPQDTTLRAGNMVSDGDAVETDEEEDGDSRFATRATNDGETLIEDPNETGETPRR